jgi:hypothetical protein
MRMCAEILFIHVGDALIATVLSERCVYVGRGGCIPWNTVSQCPIVQLLISDVEQLYSEHRVVEIDSKCVTHINLLIVCMISSTFNPK